MQTICNSMSTRQTMKSYFSLEYDYSEPPLLEALMHVIASFACLIG